jgi:hypothetical protein
VYSLVFERGNDCEGYQDELEMLHFIFHCRLLRSTAKRGNDALPWGFYERQGSPMTVPTRDGS